jgi:hypothetical protein
MYSLVGAMKSVLPHSSAANIQPILTEVVYPTDNQEIEEINRDLHAISEIVRDYGAIVKDQGGNIAQVQHLTQVVDTHTSAGVVELETAMTLTVSNTKVGLIIGSVTGFTTVGLLGLFLVSPLGGLLGAIVGGGGGGMSGYFMGRRVPH